jgi:hypothetical protein
MTEEQAESILLLFCAAYPTFDLTPPTVGLWVAKLRDRWEADIAFAAANSWIDERSKFPTIAEFFDACEEQWRARWEQQKKVLRLVPPIQAPAELSQESVHLWRASLGQPEEGCLCESCTMARQIMQRQG